MMSSSDMFILKENEFFTGNLFPVKEIMTDLKNNRIRTISFLGASVTKGEMVSKGKEFVSRIVEKWGSYFPSCRRPEVINAGKSGTLSGNAMFSMRELLVQKPDLVFLDYSVNDPGDMYLAEAFESVVYRFLKNGCYVVILLLCNHNGHCTRGAMTKIAHHYNLPLLDMGRIVMENIRAGYFSWDDFASDYVHPNIFGHDFIADNILRFFEIAEKTADNHSYEMPEEFCFQGIFSKLKIVEHFEYENLKYEYEDDFSTIVIEYLQSPEPCECSLDIYIDGEYIRTINKFSEFSWNNRVVNFLFGSEKNSRHKVELKPAANKTLSEAELKIFDVKLGIGYEQGHELINS